MSSNKIIILGSAETLSFCQDARIVSFRWDILPWCLVFDLDVPVNEVLHNGSMRRGWLAFRGMSDFSWSADAVRLPNGLVSTGPLLASKLSNGLWSYQLPILGPHFSANDVLDNNPHSKLTITAKGVVGAISSATSDFGETGPGRLQREALAGEEEFAQTIEKSVARTA